MKPSALILSLYLLMLMLLPCADGIMPVDERWGEQVLLMDASGDCTDHSHESPESCSIFCVCDCCHVHLLPTEEDSLPFHHFSIEKRHFAYVANESSSHLQVLLRPPQTA